MEQKEFRPSAPLTFGLLPSFKAIYKVDLYDLLILTYVGARPTGQPINASTTVDRDNWNNVAVSTTLPDGKLSEVVYKRVRNCEEFIGMIAKGKELFSNMHRK